MTLSEKMKAMKTPSCIRYGLCKVEGEKMSSPVWSATDDEIVVFRRDASTGKYKMFTACCEAILPPLR